MPTMDEAMATLATAVDAAKAKAVSDALAAQPAAPDPTAIAGEQETTDAAKVEAFAAQINPPPAQ
jgi:hypothetical protein